MEGKTEGYVEKRNFIFFVFFKGKGKKASLQELSSQCKEKEKKEKEKIHNRRYAFLFPFFSYIVIMETAKKITPSTNSV